MSVAHLVAVFLVFLLLLYYYFTRTFNYWKSKNVPGPKPIPIFGNIFESALRRKNMGVVFKEIYEQFANEKVVGVYRMTTPCLLLRDLDVIKQIMIKDFDIFEDRGIEFSDDCLGVNLFHANGETWRILRNRFTPIFTSGKLKNMMYLMVERANRFTDYVQDLSQTRVEHEIHSLVQKYTISTISACAFGLDIDTIGDKIEVFRKIDKLVLDMNLFFELDMMYPGILKNLNLSLFPMEVTKFFENLVKTIILQRNDTPSNAKDFMDLLLELRKQKVVTGPKKADVEQHQSLELTDSVMAAQAFVFYIAGYETSATTLTFMLYELANNPDIQQKLIGEIDEVLDNYNGEVTYESLQDMKYMHRVFDETLRMYPVVEPLQRNAKMDYHIPGTKVTLRKGQTVLVSPVGIHRDPQYYPEPDKFDPKRFAPEVANKRHICAYMPFGVGPRNCIGMRFAKLQSEVWLAKFLSRFRVTPSENTVKNIQITPHRLIMGPHRGIFLNILPRN